MKTCKEYCSRYELIILVETNFSGHVEYTLTGNFDDLCHFGFPAKWKLISDTCSNDSNKLCPFLFMLIVTLDRDNEDNETTKRIIETFAKEKNITIEGA